MRNYIGKMKKEPKVPTNQNQFPPSPPPPPKKKKTDILNFLAVLENMRTTLLYSYIETNPLACLLANCCCLVIPKTISWLVIMTVTVIPSKEFGIAHSLFEPWDILCLYQKLQRVVDLLTPLLFLICGSTISEYATTASIENVRHAPG